MKDHLKQHVRTPITLVQMRRLCDAPDRATLIGKRTAALLATMASSGAPVSREAHALIAGWMQARTVGASPPYIFTSWTDRDYRLTAQPLSKPAVWKLVQKYVAQVRFEHIRPYDFRRLVGTELARKDIRKAQKARGHMRIDTTAKHYVLDELEEGLTDDLL